MGYDIIGFVNENKNSKNFIGKADELDELIFNYNIKEVIIALDKSKQQQIFSLIHKYKNKNINISVLPDLYEIVTGLCRIDIIPGLPIMQVDAKLLSRAERNMKRFMDLALSLVFLIFATPVMLILSIMIPLESRGSALFKQKRMMNETKEFEIFKFRSMKIDAEKDTGPVWAKRNDLRTTKVGKIIRKIWLDEIPQFINVLKGEMSIVGPRPERLHFVEILEKDIPFYRRRFAVKPGITGWAQVKHKYDESVEDVVQKLKYDFYYIENMSLLLDLKIIFLTLYMVIFRKGH